MGLHNRRLTCEFLVDLSASSLCLGLLEFWLFICTFLSVSCWVSFQGLPRWQDGKESTCHCGRLKRRRFNPWSERFPWRRAWQLTLVFLPGKSPVDRGARWATVHRFSKNWTRLKGLSMHAHSFNKSSLSQFLLPGAKINFKWSNAFSALGITECLSGCMLLCGCEIGYFPLQRVSPTPSARDSSLEIRWKRNSLCLTLWYEDSTQEFNVHHCIIPGVWECEGCIGGGDQWWVTW